MAALRKLLMPKLGLTMQEGTVVEWALAENSTFAKGDVCLVIETEKVTTEVAALAAGRLLKILVSPGETVPVGAPLAEWEPLDDRALLHRQSELRHQQLAQRRHVRLP